VYLSITGRSFDAEGAARTTEEVAA
jgi:hypothetical protein